MSLLVLCPLVYRRLGGMWLFLFCGNAHNLPKCQKQELYFSSHPLNFCPNGYSKFSFVAPNSFVIIAIKSLLVFFCLSLMKVSSEFTSNSIFAILLLCSLSVFVSSVISKLKSAKLRIASAFFLLLTLSFYLNRQYDNFPLCI